MSSTNAIDRVENPPISRLALGHDGLEHRLHVVRRTGDDLQYLGRRRLLLAGFLQVFARIGDRTTLNSGGRWRNAGLGLGGLAALCWALRCGLSPRSSCRPFLMAAPYPPPGSRRASYRARPSFRKGRIGLSRRLPAGQADVCLDQSRRFGPRSTTSGLPGTDIVTASRTFQKCQNGLIRSPGRRGQGLSETARCPTPWRSAG